MRKQIMCAVGVALFVGGLCALVYGWTLITGRLYSANLFGLSVARETWCVGGIVTAMIGAALAVFGALSVRRA